MVQDLETNLVEIKLNLFKFIKKLKLYINQ